MSLANGVLVHYQDPGPGAADLSFTLTKPQLLAMLGALQRLLSVLETPSATFAIVTP